MRMMDKKREGEGMIIRRGVKGRGRRTKRRKGWMRERKRKTKGRQKEEEGEAEGGGDTGLGASHTSASRDLGILRQDILFGGPGSRSRCRILRLPPASSPAPQTSRGARGEG